MHGKGTRTGAQNQALALAPGKYTKIYLNQEGEECGWRISCSGDVPNPFPVSGKKKAY